MLRFFEYVSSPGGRLIWIARPQRHDVEYRVVYPLRIEQLPHGTMVAWFSQHKSRPMVNQLVAQGVTSALLFNSRAGWQSAGYDLDLAPRDFDVLERAFLDAQQDTWAKLLLLSPRATGQSPPDLWPDDVTMISAYMSLDQLLGPLTACALGIYECGPNSNYFRAFCLDYGGCDQPDLAALIRHVFQRDGLDPTIVDREIDRVVAIYRNRDFAALGIRRKSPG